MTIKIDKRNNKIPLSFLQCTYISILIDREIEESKVEFKKNWDNQFKVRRGLQFMEPGYIYAPYVPIMDTPVVSEYTDSNDEGYEEFGR